MGATVTVVELIGSVLRERGGRGSSGAGTEGRLGGSASGPSAGTVTSSGRLRPAPRMTAPSARTGDVHVSFLLRSMQARRSSLCA